MTKRNIFFIVAGVLLTFLGILLSTSIGAKDIPFDVVIDSIFNYENILEKQLVRDVRLPRAISAALVGGMLALTGSVMQGVTRNHVAEPSIMGMTGGATLAVAITTVNSSLFGLFGNTIAALVGAFISGILVLIFSMQKASNMNITKLLLAGSAISTFFLSLASVIALLNNRSMELAFWVAGGLRGATFTNVIYLILVGVTCSIVLFSFARKINILSMGDDIATSLGINVTKVRFLSILFMIPIIAITVASAGNIGFVGLIIPHITRKIVGTNYSLILPFSFVFGALLLTYADIVARMINHPYETPVGLFTTAIGVPIFLYLVRKRD